MRTIMSGWITLLSEPFGPLTVTSPLSTFISTPLGSGIGRFPIRDISFSELPNVTKHFAADSFAARFLIGHNPLGSRKNGNSQAAQNARNLIVPGIDPQAGFADALQVGNYLF